MQTNTIKTFGNVTKDAHTFTSKNNRKGIAFTVATNPSEGTTIYFRCYAWDRSKQFAKGLQKGMRVQLSGPVHERIANNGEIVYSVTNPFVRAIRPMQAA